MFGYDSGYDTDDTDELLTKKGCAHVPILSVSDTALRRTHSATNCQKFSTEQASVIVNEDWLFSLDSTRQQGGETSCGFTLAVSMGFPPPCRHEVQSWYKRKNFADKRLDTGRQNVHERTQCPEFAARQELGICRHSPNEQPQVHGTPNTSRQENHSTPTQAPAGTRIAPVQPQGNQ